MRAFVKARERADGERGGGGGKSWRATDGTCGGRGFWSARQRLLVDAFVGRWRGGAPSD